MMKVAANTLRTLIPARSDALTLPHSASICLPNVERSLAKYMATMMRIVSKIRMEMGPTLSWPMKKKFFTLSVGRVKSIWGCAPSVRVSSTLRTMNIMPSVPMIAGTPR